ncbi:MAG: twin-arginine translocase TatA/TatE family subunit [Thermomicrobium sp.]|nr:twin-arginine translocase TatA/TatE family subunit [Thermomicrobium sp.]MCS7246075.1 twin-arginine translocase TatA/TatE family subunit [Thermomicrobium sp.]MDW7981742.1 twin-arginine translocase TatA/TatE family subunit [Thermomicrobium sp.]
MSPLLLPSFGWQELVLVLLIVVLVFGAGRLPEIGSAIGRTIREFRAATRDVSVDASVEERGG